MHQQTATRTGVTAGWRIGCRLLRTTPSGLVDTRLLGIARHVCDRIRVFPTSYPHNSPMNLKKGIQVRERANRLVPLALPPPQSKYLYYHPPETCSSARKSEHTSASDCMQDSCCEQQSDTQNSRTFVLIRVNSCSFVFIRGSIFWLRPTAALSNLWSAILLVAALQRWATIATPVPG